MTDGYTSATPSVHHSVFELQSQPDGPWMDGATGRSPSSQSGGPTARWRNWDPVRLIPGKDPADEAFLRGAEERPVFARAPVPRGSTPANTRVVAVVVPIYTEQAHELHRTLSHLAVQQRQMNNYLKELDPSLPPASRRRVVMQVLVVFDGLWKSVPGDEEPPNIAAEDALEYLDTRRLPVHDSIEQLRRSTENPVSAVVQRVRAKQSTELSHMGSGQQDSFVLDPLRINMYTALSSPQFRSNDTAQALVREVQDRLRPGQTDIPEVTGVMEELYVSALIKKGNRRKHNSHRYFFSLFCHELDADYAFCTDVGTTYAPHMLTKLVQHLESNPLCVAACGLQRIMSAEEQEDPAEELRGEEGTLPWIYRKIQGYDYETGQAMFRAAESLMGFLMVVPGPCGLYNYRMMRGVPLHEYFDAVKRPPGESNIIEVNLQIAEDRVLTYAAMMGHTRDPRALRRESLFDPSFNVNAAEVSLTRPGEDVTQAHDPLLEPNTVPENVTIGEWSEAQEARGMDRSMGERELFRRRRREKLCGRWCGATRRPPHTAWVPSAVFHYEAEFPLDKFAKQRRRWNNGTCCGFIWLLKQLCCGSGGGSRRLRNGCCKHSMVTLLVFLQLLFYTLTFLLWGFLIVALELDLFSIGVLSESWGLIAPGQGSKLITMSAIRPILIFFGAAQVIHIVAATRKNPYTPLAWGLVVVTNAAFMVLQLAAAIGTLVTAYLRPGQLEGALKGGGSNVSIQTLRIITTTGIGYMFLPMLVGLLLGWRCLKVMFLGFFWYILNLPSMTTSLIAYSAARLNDITWGNKGGAGGAGGMNKDELSMIRWVVVVLNIAGNCIIGGVLGHVAGKHTLVVFGFVCLFVVTTAIPSLLSMIFLFFGGHWFGDPLKLGGDHLGRITSSTSH